MSRIVFIGGGNMGRALIGGLIAQGRDPSTIDVVENPDGTTTVTITSEGPGDDSVSGSRNEATFARALDGTLRLVGGSWAYRCIRSESPDSFVPRICP